MRCGIADRLAFILLLLPSVGLALANSPLHSDARPHHFLHAQSATVKEEPQSHPLPSRVMDKLKELGKDGKDREAECPKACDCQLGDKDLVSGTCFHFCSEEYEGLRYCGESSDYSGGASIDCRKCREPANFGATLQVYEPAQGTPQRSLILLNPWNGTPGWMFNWTFNQSGYGGGWRKDVSDHYRVVNACGKKMPGTDYTAWFGYATADDWFSDTPIQRDVDAAVAYIHHLIEEEYKVVGDYSRIILAGMSQGAGLALEAALNFHEALGLVLSERGIVRSSEVLRSSRSVAKSPYVLMMGKDDHYYGVDLAKKSCRFLQKMGAPVLVKAVQGLEHDSDAGAGRERELELALDILAAIPSQAPADSFKALAGVTDWSACD